MINFNNDMNKNIGKIFHNSNGNDYFIIYQNLELDRTLLHDIETKMYIVAWGLNFKNQCWSQGHYFMEDFKSAVNYVLGKEVK